MSLALFVFCTSQTHMHAPHHDKLCWSNHQLQTMPRARPADSKGTLSHTHCALSLTTSDVLGQASRQQRAEEGQLVTTTTLLEPNCQLTARAAAAAADAAHSTQEVTPLPIRQGAERHHLAALWTKHALMQEDGTCHEKGCLVVWGHSVPALSPKLANDLQRATGAATWAGVVGRCTR